ncbi:hypothetical protein ACJIZ3_023294 [Penstemon smallii]|uniref:TF-B3 domain-containing protein n=1 Tax=Penstemon smallii TaxID=265156 RepID=A0ABD3TQP1_9LAMI
MNNQFWVVRLNENQGRYKFGAGWKRFITENNLTDGDRLIFQEVPGGYDVVVGPPGPAAAAGHPPGPAAT